MTPVRLQAGVFAKVRVDCVPEEVDEAEQEDACGCGEPGPLVLGALVFGFGRRRRKR